MIKSEIIAEIAKKLTHIPEQDVADTINFIIEQMSDTLGDGGRIEIRGFGSFCLHLRPPRNAHNPKTGQRVITNAKFTPHFKPGKALRERINNNRHLPIKQGKDDDDVN